MDKRDEHLPQTRVTRSEKDTILAACEKEQVKITTQGRVLFLEWARKALGIK